MSSREHLRRRAAARPLPITELAPADDANARPTPMAHDPRVLRNLPKTGQRPRPPRRGRRSPRRAGRSRAPDVGNARGARVVAREIRSRRPSRRGRRRHRAFAGKRGAPQAFPHLLFMMLEREVEAGTVHWCEGGAAFEIADLDGFIADTLVKYFRHSRYASFQRQLNLYGFKKNADGAFEHESFLRDRPELLTRVRAQSTKGGRARRAADAAAAAPERRRDAKRAPPAPAPVSTPPPPKRKRAAPIAAAPEPSCADALWGLAVSPRSETSDAFFAPLLACPIPEAAAAPPWAPLPTPPPPAGRDGAAPEPVARAAAAAPQRALPVAYEPAVEAGVGRVSTTCRRRWRPRARARAALLRRAPAGAREPPPRRRGALARSRSSRPRRRRRRGRAARAVAPSLLPSPRDGSEPTTESPRSSSRAALDDRIPSDEVRLLNRTFSDVGSDTWDVDDGPGEPAAAAAAPADPDDAVHALFDEIFAPSAVFIDR
ncbi:DNA binding protein [Aureococcus anophagefferens]|nr:DNA binding protein [Aureococcus anophagefferens]